ncbi:oligopeptide transport system ATP-binding protein [Desulfacinum infernum DSM 9756]|uniref:Oligopeptide transport system ATP-binding protein n=1 Tax=Desulfacinum infernum DSM 9756 TaxID=1121391 RepID=A0A1M4YGF9_9BACT|nr:dipeptide ABC transporter ATP-binding protein [Desulfacinum infernum]SHF04837.1 oligopeptide transport system ATP-binding protein [Desulfacinum infernum DSM 9756]
MKDVICEARNLVKHYPVRSSGFGARAGVVRAVDGVSFRIARREVFALVGESGCGKSTLGRLLLRIEEPTRGSVLFEGRDLVASDAREVFRFRRRAQIIYQDPYSALNPRKKIGRLVEEPLVIHKIGTPAERRERVAWLLERVGLRPEHAERYPHEFSGGQRQRIVIARALALNPVFVVADEPVSALDVSIQAQVINLLEELQEDLELTYLFISHDLSVVEHMAHRIGVMYLGRLVEIGPKAAFFQDPLHPYSRALLSAAPVPDPRAAREKRRILLEGDVPSPIRPPSGCPFHPRCPEREDVCSREIPPLKEVGPGRRVACHRR